MAYAAIDYGLPPPRATYGLVGHFSGVLQDRLLAHGDIAIQFDYRRSMGQGPHVRGNVRYALQIMLRMHPLQGIIFSFPCKNICDADNTPGVREAKVKDGRYIFGMLQVIWMFCIATRLVRRIAGELPLTHLDRMWDSEAWGVIRQRVELQNFSDMWQKATVWRLAGLPRLVDQGALDGKFPSLPHSVPRGLSDDERERRKAAFTLGHSEAIATQWCTRHLLELRHPPRTPIDFVDVRAHLIHNFKAKWPDVPLPVGWDHPEATPPAGDEAERIAALGEFQRAEQRCGGRVVVRAVDDAPISARHTVVRVDSEAQHCCCCPFKPTEDCVDAHDACIDAFECVLRQLGAGGVDLHEIAARHGLPAECVTAQAIDLGSEALTRLIAAWLDDVRRSVARGEYVQLACTCYPHRRCHCESLAIAVLRPGHHAYAFDSSLGYPGEGWSGEGTSPTDIDGDESPTDIDGSSPTGGRWSRCDKCGRARCTTCYPLRRRWLDGRSGSGNAHNHVSRISHIGHKPHIGHRYACTAAFGRAAAMQRKHIRRRTRGQRRQTAGERAARTLSDDERCERYQRQLWIDERRRKTVRAASRAQAVAEARAVASRVLQARHRGLEHAMFPVLPGPGPAGDVKTVFMPKTSMGLGGAVIVPNTVPKPRDMARCLSLRRRHAHWNRLGALESFEAALAGMKELRSETATDWGDTTRATPPVADESADADTYPLHIGSSRSEVARAVLEPTTLLQLAQCLFGGAAFGYSGTYRHTFGYNHPRGGACTAWLWPILFGSKPKRKMGGGIGKGARHRLDAEYCPSCGKTWQTIPVRCDVSVRCDCADPPAQGAPGAAAPGRIRSTLEFDSTLGYPGEGWSCVPAAPSTGAGRLIVLPVHVSDKARVCVPAGGHLLFGESMLEAGGAARKAASQRAAAICAQLGTDATIDTVFLAGTMHDDHITVGVCKSAQSTPVCDKWADMVVAEAIYGAGHPVWCTLDAIAGCDGMVTALHQHVYMVAAAALARTSTFLSPTTETATVLKHGASSGGAVAPHLDATAQQGSFESQLLLAQRADVELKRALLDAADECGDVIMAAAYIDWADRFSPVPLADMPAGLRAQVRDFGVESALATTPFVHRGAIPTTHAVGAPEPQLPAEDNFSPEAVDDILEEWAIAAIDSKLLELRRWHAARLAGGKAHRPTALALGEDAVKPRARGRVWDLRDVATGGKPKLMDTVTPPIKSHLNVDFLEDLFAQCVDKELVSMLRFGVTIRAELAPQIVIMPNLLSLYDDTDGGAGGIDAAADAMDELKQLGWYGVTDFIPFVPWRCTPRGVVTKRGGGLPRGIVDHGAPRTPHSTMFSGEVVRAINEVAREGRPKGEHKPLFGDVAHNAAVLKHAADSIGEPLFFIAFDFAKFFHQLFYAAHELWKMGSMMPPRAAAGGADAELLAFVEHVMAMGMTPSSEIAQRFANALMQAFCRRLDEAEAKANFIISEAEAAWRSTRSGLAHDQYGTQARLFDANMYTDDPAMCVVGVRRTVLAIRVWHEMVGGAGLMAAKVSKWQIGAGGVWLGINCYPSLGLMWVPKDKTLDAVRSIDETLRGTIAAAEYRRLVGFLEHVAAVINLPRELLDHLHHPMRQGGEVERDPSGPLQPDGRRDGYLRKWRAMLLNSAGASLLRAVPALAGTEKKTSTGAPATTWRLRSDAALEANLSGLGGCFYGEWWHLELRRPKLTIPTLEALAACVNYFVFQHRLQNARDVVLEIDAVASSFALAKGKAKAAGIRAVIHPFLRNKLVNTNRFLRVEHLYGEANPLADAASRGKVAELLKLCDALGLEQQQVGLPDEAIRFIDEVLEGLGEPSMTGKERKRARLEFDSSLGFPGEGPPHGTSPSSDIGNPWDLASPGLARFVERSEHKASHGSAAVAHWANADLREAVSNSPVAWYATGVPDTLGTPVDGGITSPTGELAPPSPLEVPEESTFPSPPKRAKACSPPSMALPEAAGASASVKQEETSSGAGDAIDWGTSPTWCPLFEQATGSTEIFSTGADTLAADAAGAFDALRESTLGAALSALRRLDSTPGGESSIHSQAARARAQSLAALLQADKSRYGMRFEEGEADAACLHLMQVLEQSAARTTLANEKSNWKHWLAFCAHRNTAPWRQDTRGMIHAEYDKEVIVLSFALLYIYGRMNCKPGRKAPPKPASALAVLRGIRRSHDRLGIVMADLRMVTKLADSLNREYVEKYGAEALQPHRKEPLTNPIIEGMLRLPEMKGKALAAKAWRALWATLAQTGFRKAEISVARGSEFGKTFLTRHHLRWRIGGKDVPDPTAAQLLGLTSADFAILIPPKSKCDQFGLEWGQNPIYLRFRDEVPINAARELRNLELSWPLHGIVQREEHALFVDGSHQPLTGDAVDAKLRSQLEKVVPAGTASRYSPHSFRRYLACALMAANVDRDHILALLRWKTSESLAIYAKLNDRAYADMVDAAGTADISSIQSNSIPQADMLDAAGSMQRCRAALDAAARRAHSHPPEEDEPTDVDEDSDGDGIIQGGATTTVVAALTSGPAPAPTTSRLVSGPNPHRARRSLG